MKPIENTNGRYAAVFVGESDEDFEGCLQAMAYGPPEQCDECEKGCRIWDVYYGVWDPEQAYLDEHASDAVCDCGRWSDDDEPRDADGKLMRPS